MCGIKMLGTKKCFKNKSVNLKLKEIAKFLKNLFIKFKNCM